MGYAEEKMEELAYTHSFASLPKDASKDANTNTHVSPLYIYIYDYYRMVRMQGCKGR